jgi:hypothetical protein
VTSLDVCIVVPVLKRPHRVKPLLENIAASTPEGSYRVLFVATPYDAKQLEALGRNLTDYLITPWEGGPGDYARKINYGYKHSTEPLIFTGADDLNFHPGWLEAAKACLLPNVGVVGTNDLYNPGVKAGLHSTHSLVRREYADLGTVDEPRKIYHEGYEHCFVDNEMVQTARARKAFVHCPNSVVEHIHPHARKAPTDAVYRLSEQSLRQGRRLYSQRQKLWASGLPEFSI